MPVCQQTKGTSSMRPRTALTRVSKRRRNARNSTLTFSGLSGSGRLATPSPGPTNMNNTRLINSTWRQTSGHESNLVRLAHQTNIAAQLLTPHNKVLSSIRDCAGEAGRMHNLEFQKRQFAKLLGPYISHDAPAADDMLAHFGAFAAYLDNDQTKREATWDLCSQDTKVLMILVKNTIGAAKADVRAQLREAKHRKRNLKDEALATSDVNTAVHRTIAYLSSTDSTERFKWIQANNDLADMLERPYQL